MFRAALEPTWNPKTLNPRTVEASIFTNPALRPVVEVLHIMLMHGIWNRNLVTT